MFCPNCGSNIADGSKFCPSCGQNLAQQDEYQQGQGGYQQGGYQQGGYQQGGYQQNAGAYITPSQPQDSYQQYNTPLATEPLRTDRDILMYVLLTIVTCGIYGYWYVYQMAKDANTICYADGDSTPELLIYILLSILTCGIYSYYWMYKLANRLQTNGPRYGIAIQEGGSDVLLWFVLGYFTCSLTSYVGMNIIIKNMNALSIAYNQANGLQ